MKSSQEGLTLIEVLIAGGLVSALAIFGAKNFDSLINVEKTMVQESQLSQDIMRLSKHLYSVDNCRVSFDGKKVLPAGDSTEGSFQLKRFIEAGIPAQDFNIESNATKASGVVDVALKIVNITALSSNPLDTASESFNYKKSTGIFIPARQHLVHINVVYKRTQAKVGQAAAAPAETKFQHKILKVVVATDDSDRKILDCRSHFFSDPSREFCEKYLGGVIVQDPISKEFKCTRIAIKSFRDGKDSMNDIFDPGYGVIKKRTSVAPDDAFYNTDNVDSKDFYGKNNNTYINALMASPGDQYDTDSGDYTRFETLEVREPENSGPSRNSIYFDNGRVEGRETANSGPSSMIIAAVGKIKNINEVSNPEDRFKFSQISVLKFPPMRAYFTDDFKESSVSIGGPTLFPASADSNADVGQAVPSTSFKTSGGTCRVVYMGMNSSPPDIVAWESENDGGDTHLGVMDCARSCFHKRPTPAAGLANILFYKFIQHSKTLPTSKFICYLRPEFPPEFALFRFDAYLAVTGSSFVPAPSPPTAPSLVDQLYQACTPLIPATSTLKETVAIVASNYGTQKPPACSLDNAQFKKLWFIDETGEKAMYVAPPSGEVLTVVALNPAGTSTLANDSTGSITTKKILAKASNDDTLGVGWAPLYFYGQTPTYSSSDRKMKKNIRNLSKSYVERAFSLRPRSFVWKKSKARDFGFIAQEVQKKLPFLAHKSGGTLMLNSGELLAPMLAKLQENQKKIDKLHQSVNSLLGQDRVRNK